MWSGGGLIWAERGSLFLLFRRPRFGSCDEAGRQQVDQHKPKPIGFFIEEPPCRQSRQEDMRPANIAHHDSVHDAGFFTLILDKRSCSPAFWISVQSHGDHECLNLTRTATIIDQMVSHDHPIFVYKKFQHETCNPSLHISLRGLRICPS